MRVLVRDKADLATLQQIATGKALRKFAFGRTPEVSIEGEWKQDLTTVELGRPLSEVLSEITFDEIGTRDPALHAAWIIDRLRKIGVCFSAGDQGQGSRLLLAGQWLFDSYVGQNDLLSFVQTMIALEILLGDKERSDLLGLNELLRN